MKAKQRFFALGQSAKMRGVNRQRALKHFHMEGAPKWARNAFVAGWDAADTEHTISYFFEELEDCAKDKVREWLTPDHGWWDSVYDMLDEDSKEYHIEIDRRTRQGCVVTYEELTLYFDSRYGYDVQFEGSLDVRSALATWKSPTYLAFSSFLEEVDVLPRFVTIKDSALRDLELGGSHSSEDRVREGTFQGALIEDVLQGLEDMSFFQDLEEFLQSKVDAFKKLAEEALEAEYDYQTSDEYIAESCEANEYVFDEDGNHI